MYIRFILGLKAELKIKYAIIMPTKSHEIIQTKSFSDFIRNCNHISLSFLQDKKVDLLFKVFIFFQIVIAILFP